MPRNIWELKGRVPSVLIVDNVAHVVVDWSKKLRFVHKGSWPLGDVQAEDNPIISGLNDWIDIIVSRNVIDTTEWQRWAPPVKDGTLGKHRYKYTMTKHKESSPNSEQVNHS